MMGWMRRMFPRPPKPPPVPRDPLNGAPLHAIPAGSYRGRPLTLAEHRYVLAMAAAKREAIERDIDRQAAEEEEG